MDVEERKLIEDFFNTVVDELREGFNVKDQYGISKNFYSGLGLIAAECARAEELVGYLCFLIFDIEPPTGVPLIANLGYRSRVQVLLSITDATVTKAEELFGTITNVPRLL